MDRISADSSSINIKNLKTQGYDSTNRGKEGGGEGGPPVAGGLRPPEAYPAAVVT